jgi:hypothetical protein
MTKNLMRPGSDPVLKGLLSKNQNYKLLGEEYFECGAQIFSNCNILSLFIS